VGKFDHFETPLGVFDHVLSNRDFRAEGTQNDHGFRGFGSKGMRVYDMGSQEARRASATRVRNGRQRPRRDAMCAGTQSD
jgi:hypothetical protein